MASKSDAVAGAYFKIFTWFVTWKLTMMDDSELLDLAMMVALFLAQEFDRTRGLAPDLGPTGLSCCWRGQ